MPTVDSTAQAALASPAHAEAFFIWVDVAGDPIRITTFGKDVTFTGTGDPDLDGQTFISFDHRAIQVSDVQQSDNGSDTLTVSMSGIANVVDSGLMAEIADVTKWRSRTVRLWMQTYDETGTVKQGAIVPYYTGYASTVGVKPAPDSQTVEMAIENYQAAFNQASNRDYLNQSAYDPADSSASATLASANMGRFGGGGAGGGGGGGACVVEGTPILVAPDAEIPATPHLIGQMILTQHADTLAWGYFQVVGAVRVADQPVFLATVNGRPLRGTAGHRVFTAGQWVQLQDIGEPDGVAAVMKISVKDAQTYVSNGILSHNVKVIGDARDTF